MLSWVANLGFAGGGTVVAVAAQPEGGHFIPEAELRRLRRIHRNIAERTQQQFEHDLTARARDREELELVYNRVAGLEELPPAEVEKVVVAAAQVTTVTRVPERLPIFDFDAVVSDLNALKGVVESLTAILEHDNEEEEVLAVLTAASMAGLL